MCTTNTPEAGDKAAYKTPLKGENKGAVEKANAVTAPKREDFESMLVVTPWVSSSSEWILDSGCSYHMCLN